MKNNISSKGRVKRKRENGAEILLEFRLRKVRSQIKSNSFRRMITIKLLRKKIKDLVDY
jgi:hypothetical protein